MMNFSLGDYFYKFDDMKTKSRSKLKRLSVTIDESLDRYNDESFYPKKHWETVEYFEKHGLPDFMKEHLEKNQRPK